MSKEHRPNGRAATETSADDLTRRPSLVEAREFAEDLRRRGEAARGLEKDLLTDVPLLYGSPGRWEPCGDPGVVLAKIHREEIVRRNKGGITPFSSGKSPAELPFERAVIALAILIAIVFFSGVLD